MQSFEFSVIVTTDTYDHALRVMQEHMARQQPLIESGVEIDYQIEIDWVHSGTRVEGPLLAR